MDESVVRPKFPVSERLSEITRPNYQTANWLSESLNQKWSHPMYTRCYRRG